MKLVSMIDFVLERKEFWREESMKETAGETYCRSQHSKDCENYANFLKKSLTLDMLVPCGKDGKILGKPLGYNQHVTMGGGGFFDKGCKEYHEAKERVMFEVEKEGQDYFLDGHNVKAIIEWKTENKKVEDLITWTPKLTQAAQIKLSI